MVTPTLQKNKGETQQVKEHQKVDSSDSSVHKAHHFQFHEKIWRRVGSPNTCMSKNTGKGSHFIG